MSAITAGLARGALSRVLGLALGPAVALGLGRFAYALLLPAMRSHLGWSYAQAGAINTANALGYLFGALVTGAVVRRVGARAAFVAGVIVTAVSILASATTGSLGLLGLLRFVTGAAGAAVFISGAALVARIAADSSDRGAMLLGVYVAGAGSGIAVSGALVPAVLGDTGADGWRIGWLALGLLALLAAAVATLAARGAAEPPSAPAGETPRWPWRTLAASGLGYGLFGAGYIAYATFIVAYLRHQGLSSPQLAGFWVVLGVAAVVAAFSWERPLRHLRGGRGPAIVIAVVTVGALLPLTSGGIGVAFASAVVFGGSFLSVVTAVTDLARRMVPEHAVTAAIVALTTAFALGQCAGPILAGVLSDGPSGVRAGLTLSVAILAAGALVSLAQRERRAAAPQT